jgi:hypothetical protein
VKNRIFYKICRVITTVLAVLIVFSSTDFVLSEITDKLAYEDATGNDKKWSQITEKFENDMTLTESDYEEIFNQSGLGKPAVNRLLDDGRPDKIEEYRDYYLKDKEFYCYRKWELLWKLGIHNKGCRQVRKSFSPSTPEFVVFPDRTGDQSQR